ncbi:MAG: DUF6278 family protein [Thermoproteota archaeon]
MWHWKRRKNNTLGPRQGSFAKWAGKCVELAGEKAGVKLDYSLESLKSLDAADSRLRLDAKDPGELPSDVLGAYLILTGSYLGEVIVRNLSGKWEKTESPLGWAVRLGGEEIDVFQVAFESISEPSRFSEFYRKLCSEEKNGETTPRENTGILPSELEELMARVYTSEEEKPEEQEQQPWENSEEQPEC